ncbi:hypothetical protein GCM10009634_85280 [Saccharothrix xinjiangensis]
MHDVLGLALGLLGHLPDLLTRGGSHLSGGLPGVPRHGGAFLLSGLADRAHLVLGHDWLLTVGVLSPRTYPWRAGLINFTLAKIYPTKCETAPLPG